MTEGKSDIDIDIKYYPGDPQSGHPPTAAGTRTEPRSEIPSHSPLS